MKPMPVSAMHSATCAGVRSIDAPSASSTSALPDFDDTLRPPCLATRAPAAAATNIDAVEMLKLERAIAAGADDVEQMRVVARHRHLGRQLAHHPRRAGDLADGFLLHAQAGDDRRRHQRADLAAHDLAHQRDHLVVEDLAVLDRALQRFLRRDRDGAPCLAGRSRFMRPAAAAAEEIAQQVVAVLGQDRLRMELHALDRQRLVAQAHDLVDRAVRRSPSTR